MTRAAADVDPSTAFDLLGRLNSPVLLYIAGGIIVASMLSERVAKILGPLGKIGRLWQTRQERAEADAQALYAARRKALEEVAADQLRDLDAQLRYFVDVVVPGLREENAALREELQAVHALLDDTRRDTADTRQRVRKLGDLIDTGERIAVIPPPPAGRHRPEQDDDTQRIGGI